MTGPRPGDGPRPVTYGTADAARAYVAAVLGWAALPDGPVYVSAAPEVAGLRRWAALAGRLAGLLPGVPLAGWADARPPAGLDRAQRAAYLAATHPAVVVVALRRGPGRPLGYGVLAEAEAFAAQGRPVLVFTGRRLAAWPDCRTRPVPPAKGRPLAAWLDVPAAPPRTLPTFIASLRALGITDLEIISRAARGAPDGPPRPGAPSARPPSPRPPASRSGPPGPDSAGRRKHPPPMPARRPA